MRLLPLVEAWTIGLVVWGVASPCLASASRLDFRDIEYRDQGDEALVSGKAEIAGAIGIGGAVSDSVSLLHAAGAHCRPLGHETGAVRCIYNQMSFDGDALDEVRWTTIVHGAGGRVTDVDVRREVDTRVID